MPPPGSSHQPAGPTSGVTAWKSSTRPPSSVSTTRTASRSRSNSELRPSGAPGQQPGRVGGPPPRRPGNRRHPRQGPGPWWTAGPGTRPAAPSARPPGPVTSWCRSPSGAASRGDLLPELSRQLGHGHVRPGQRHPPVAGQAVVGDAAMAGARVGLADPQAGDGRPPSTAAALTASPQATPENPTGCRCPGCPVPARRWPPARPARAAPRAGRCAR